MIEQGPSSLKPCHAENWSRGLISRHFLGLICTGMLLNSNTKTSSIAMQKVSLSFVMNRKTFITSEFDEVSSLPNLYVSLFRVMYIDKPELLNTDLIYLRDRIVIVHVTKQAAILVLCARYFIQTHFKIILHIRYLVIAHTQRAHDAIMT